MATELDTHVLELLASKICHDLVSPIGAVNNGIEFMQEMGADAGPDATDLIAYSATQASAKLKAYRMAYGAGGADGSIKPEEVKAAIHGMVSADGKITQEWDEHNPELGMDAEKFERTPAFSKMLICLLLQAMDCLPKGGVMVVEGSGKETTVTARGENAAFRDRSVDALSLDLHNSVMEPKYVHAMLTGLLAKNYGYALTASSSEGEISLSMQYIGE
jgi:histidine phosphotransferase ChpT